MAYNKNNTSGQIFHVYNPEGERVGVLDYLYSVQWLENYQTEGEVKLEANASDDNYYLLAKGNRIYNAEIGTAARICNVELTHGDKEDKIIAHAYTGAGLLRDRVVMATERVTNIETAMYSIYEKNRRDLPVEVAAAEGFTEETETEITWGSVLEAEKKLAELAGFGFTVLFDPETGEEQFKVYKGVDRSKEDGPNYIGYFGTDVDNIQNISIISGDENYKNVAVVAGSSQDGNRVIRTVSLSETAGKNRREIYVDARDLQKEYQTAVPTGGTDNSGNPVYSYSTKTYTEEEYNAVLDARGRKKLAEYLRTFSITCDVIQNNMQFGVDYFLGDRMPIRLPQYGISATARITAATRVYESSGDKITIVLNEFNVDRKPIELEQIEKGG